MGNNSSGVNGKTWIGVILSRSLYSNLSQMRPNNSRNPIAAMRFER